MKGISIRIAGWPAIMAGTLLAACTTTPPPPPA